MSNKIYVTKEWLTNLENELETLKTSKRVEIAEKLKEAISFWDLSENSEYEDARSEQAQVELRISDLEEQLKHIEIIEEWGEKWWRVNMWVIVEIKNLESGEVDKLKIVGSTESNILAETPTISNDSPIWKALLWKKKWQKVKVSALAWNFEYEVISIK